MGSGISPFSYTLPWEVLQYVVGKTENYSTVLIPGLFKLRLASLSTVAFPLECFSSLVLVVSAPTIEYFSTWLSIFTPDQKK